MAKVTKNAQLKGKLEVDFNTGSGIVTEVTKEAEFEYDFFKLLEEFNGKTVKISISEENEIETIGETE